MFQRIQYWQNAERHSNLFYNVDVCYISLHVWFGQENIEVTMATGRYDVRLLSSQCSKHSPFLCSFSKVCQHINFCYSVKGRKELDHNLVFCSNIVIINLKEKKRRQENRQWALVENQKLFCFFPVSTFFLLLFIWSFLKPFIKIV